MQKKYEYDAVIVGSGIGGLATAVTASENELDILILEKSSRIGGSSGLSGGNLWIPDSHLLENEDVDDSAHEAITYLQDISGSEYVDTGAIERYVEASPEALRFFKETIDFDVGVSTVPDYHYPIADGSKERGRYLYPEPIDGKPLGDWNEKIIQTKTMDGATMSELLDWGGWYSVEEWDWETIKERKENQVRTGGSGMTAYFLKGCLNRNVDIKLETSAEELVTVDGAVQGVVVYDEETGERYEVSGTKGVVLTTGAYDWDPSLFSDLEHLPDEHTRPTSIPTATGDGLRMAASIGGKLGIYPPISGSKLFVMEVPKSERLGEPNYWMCLYLGLPHAIAVNSNGKRFCDGSFHQNYIKSIYNPEGDYSDLPCWMLFDGNYKEKYQLGPYMPDDEFPKEFLAAKGDSLTEVAKQLGVSPETLERTVSKYNSNVENGEDTDFSRGTSEWAQVMSGDRTHKPHPNLGVLENPPFYAVRLYMGLYSMSSVGLVTDDHGNVLDWYDKPVSNLYASGSVVAPLEWGIGYQSGMQNARAMTYGYLIGRSLSS